jgi:hypothetical protein
VYLVDTNVWLERLLDQERSEEVGQFLDRTPTELINLTLVSFDADFDRTERGRKTPADVLKGLPESP